MCYRESRAGADGREFAGSEPVDGGVRGILLIVREGIVRYTGGVSFSIPNLSI
jgi:hypothetical protein